MAQKKITDYINSETKEKINDSKIVEISFNSNKYPTLLKRIKDPPKRLYAIGNIELLNMASAAIVGTRKPSKKGEWTCEKIAKQYGEKGYAIVSGLALGVDALAMKAALSVNAPIIGVLPSPLDNIIPPKNRPLATEILKNNGLLISEYIEGTKVQKYFFVKRNRIVSGISELTIIIETSEKGGTMHTVKFAEEQEKPIYVADLPTAGNKYLKKKGFKMISI